ncbi:MULTISPECIES: translation initiation factor 2 [unclassified Pseudomonas]|uniref:translation initiation factor 2 n=1 Tax=unclassified Pseudomonas TaxID=196821 RepID=UPI000D356797|nr:MULTISPECIES: translation initiation factor 2 [unclassified Pseudomonas]RAU45870.1 translation initiation factor 2 [Pseudomonas sp. RIT 409]RAU56031.1 translation initiation factor 2 [Pseudomonas sp. RIT 412]
MRPRPWCVLAAALAVSLISFDVRAEESSDAFDPAQPLPPAASELVELRERLAQSEKQREELTRQLHNADAERESIQLGRLRQENQRLKLQLKEAQSVMPARVLTEQQQWFVTGGGVAVVALLCGIFASGWRRQRRQWLN